LLLTVRGPVFVIPPLFPSARTPPAHLPLSLHDALPIFEPAVHGRAPIRPPGPVEWLLTTVPALTRIPARILGGMRVSAGTVVSRDRKSTRLNSSHVSISYAVFCLKRKNCTRHINTPCVH